jgi:hypothetical protein
MECEGVDWVRLAKDIGLNGKFLRFRRDGTFFEALSYIWQKMDIL